MLLWPALRTGHRSLRDANVFLFLHVPVATVAISPHCSNGNSHARLLEQFAPSTIKATFHSIPDQLLTFYDPNGIGSTLSSLTDYALHNKSWMLASKKNDTYFSSNIFIRV